MGRRGKRRDRTSSGDGAGEEPSGDEGSENAPLRCELCGGPVLDRHCKVTCLNCGFQRDCSDP